MIKFCCSITTFLCIFAAFPLLQGSTGNHFLYPDSLVTLPQDGRKVFYEAFSAAKKKIRIEICVLEDPRILKSLNKALKRGVDVKVIVDKGKYEALQAERVNLRKYLTKAGGALHLSNPIFPRSFPKVILIDDRYVLIGSACLDTTTFEQYRDYVYVSDDSAIIEQMKSLFKNDWRYSAKPDHSFPTFNPTPPIKEQEIIIGPVNGAEKLVAFLQQARKTVDITTELLGNPTLESELFAAVKRGVRVRLISPEKVNGATSEEQTLQETSLDALKEAGIKVHVTVLPETAKHPYMHARMAVVDGKIAYLGSISLSPDSSTFNREVGLIHDHHGVVRKLHRQFGIDYSKKSVKW